MTDATAEQAEVSGKSGKKGMIIGVILAIAGAAGGYFLTVSGLLPIGGAPTAQESKETGEDTPAKALPKVGFVDLAPVIVSVNASDSRHLKFHAQLEVNDQYMADVEKMKPRIMDVLNGYLRAIKVADLEDSLALMRIRGHLLRRIEIVVGEGRVRDVLVMEFVLN
ncbi:flagellar basal body-associated protein FliL [Ruegeria sp. Ofav3-42]|uniref:flagellar basal body-associated FliL family protein n=1 Tax=Ruegeria sp. Ofav3-42 TaxID=2917759 RepID=UPI001EF6FDE3|nr:flagellar basal body-associated FliL family protein [Ruegeria sp. Ofav3-42]MCG7521094.1 flagellar basal body-associated FliL family protein [Ruegeria sp. Ofav3-42]